METGVDHVIRCQTWVGGQYWKAEW